MLLAFIVVLGILIFVHELGHFLAAKAAGVRVLTFSLGFGPKMIRFRRGETDYQVAWLPLGGYVKMAGEAPEEWEEDAPEEDPKPGDFMYASVPRRGAIIAAGPLMNLVLAVLFFSLLAVVGGQQVLPVTTVGMVEEQSLADRAGIRPYDRIVAVNDREVTDWYDGIRRLHDGIGAEHTVTIEREGERRLVRLPSLITAQGELNEEAAREYGLGPLTTPRLAAVVDTGAAARAGIKEGDLITAMSGRPVDSGSRVAAAVRELEPGESIEIAVDRHGAAYTFLVLPDWVDDGAGGRIPRIGVGFELDFVTRSIGPIAALGVGSRETWRTLVLTTDIVRRLVTGRISAKTLGGPIMIAQVAGDTARSGLRNLVFFIAFLSVNLAVLNLLPIPILDGGHLVFLLAEAVRGRPLPLKVRLMALQLGMVFLIMLMLYVTFNDVMRFF